MALAFINQLLGGIHLCEFEDRLYSELQDSLRYIVRSCLIKIITNNKILKNGFTKQPQRKYFSSVFKKKKKNQHGHTTLKEQNMRLSNVESVSKFSGFFLFLP